MKYRSDLSLSSADQNSEMMNISTEQKNNQCNLWHGSNTVQKKREGDYDDLVLVEKKKKLPEDEIEIGN